MNYVVIVGILKYILMKFAMDEIYFHSVKY